MTWFAIAALCVATVALKGAGPLTVGGRRPSERTLSVSSLLAPALLAGLVVYETFGSTDGPGLAFDARAGGLIAGALAIVLRLPILVVVAVAAITTAALRAVL
jgi:Branched-chain amino acid transport protein (AzlD)